MTSFKLLLRNLRYFRGVNLAVILGMAVATAVLSGALMVGDSVRGSLADLALRRLGQVDYSLISTRFFDQSLASRLAATGDAKDTVTSPAIIVNGGASNQAGDTRTADVQIAAIGAPLAGRPSIGGSELQLAPGASVINGELAGGLGLSQAGGGIILSIAAQSDIARESALSRRGRNDVLNQLNAGVKQIESQPDFISLFNPNGSQRVSRNAWVNIKDLQEAAEQGGRVNAILVHADGGSSKDDDFAKTLNDRLKKVAVLGDYGLSISSVGDNEASVFARDTYIAPPAVDAAKKTADSLHLRLRAVSVNLINSVTNLSAAGKEAAPVIHYAVAAGITTLDDGALGESEIAINQWTAEQLGAKVGDKLAIDFYLRQPGGDLTDASKALPKNRLKFTVKTILPMSGLGADAKLAPNYKGLTDAQSVADWDPPEGLTIDKKLVTKADEDYWHTYRAAPKLYVNFDTAKKLWGGVYGDVTGLRVPIADAEKFEKAFVAELRPESMGFVFRPIKAEQLAAANGGTDFAMFFLMFSFFLIVAAALLVAMLFRLNIEQRARQLGLMSAVGFSPASLRRLALGEGMLLAVIGGITGLGGAVGYTSFIMYGLRTWWIGAVGTTAMTLHVVPMTLAYGLVGSFFVAFFAILWAVWRIGKAQPARLLAGGWGMNIPKQRQGRWPRWIGIGCCVVGVIVVAVAMMGKISSEEGFGGGGLILCGLLSWLGSALRPRRHEGASFAGAGSLTRLGIRNATRHTARGVLSVGLIAVAAYALITVAAMKQNGIANPDSRDSETGGYRLILTAGIPLTGDLNSVSGRKLLGFRQPDDAAFAGVRFTMIRQWQGQDISCLNLTRPTSPTILGLPDEMIQRGGFVTEKTKGPFWNILNSDHGGQIPVVVDSDTLEYVLQTEIGKTIPLTDQLGVSRQLLLAGAIDHSIFQGQLLMSDANFKKLFPAQSGFGVVLIDKPDGKMSDEQQSQLSRKLSSELGDYSVSVDTTVSRLKTYQNVQNTYLETFQTLGGLGLMLGTLGLAVVLVRTVIERKAELALLASLGFTAMARVTLVLSENAFLLVLGLLLGAGSAVIGILPAVINGRRPINVLYLFATLAIVLVIGLVSSIIAVVLSGVHVAPADLRKE